MRKNIHETQNRSHHSQKQKKMRGIEYTLLYDETWEIHRKQTLLILACDVIHH